VPDPVERSERVPHPDRVQPAPLLLSEDAGVDLQMEVTVRVTGPGGMMRDHRGLDPLHRHLHLLVPRPNPGSGLLGDPADDLLRRPGLRSVVRGGNLRIQCGRQRPGLRTVDHDLGEPHTLRTRHQPAFRYTRVDVVSRHPPLVGVAIHRRLAGKD
jgi:hypothetical protein